MKEESDHNEATGTFELETYQSKSPSVLFLTKAEGACRWLWNTMRDKSLLLPAAQENVSCIQGS